MKVTRIILLICILSFVVNKVTAQNPTDSYKYTLLTYGLQDDVRRNASSLIQSKWKIKILPIAGCVVTQELEDSVKRENDKIYKLIQYLLE